MLQKRIADFPNQWTDLKNGTFRPRGHPSRQVWGHDGFLRVNVENFADKHLMGARPDGVDNLAFDVDWTIREHRRVDGQCFAQGRTGHAEFILVPQFR